MFPILCYLIHWSSKVSVFLAFAKEDILQLTHQLMSQLQWTSFQTPPETLRLRLLTNLFIGLVRTLLILLLLMLLTMCWKSLYRLKPVQDLSRPLTYMQRLVLRLLYGPMTPTGSPTSQGGYGVSADDLFGLELPLACTHHLANTLSLLGAVKAVEPELFDP